MDLFDRIYDLHQLLSNARYPITHRSLQEKLECSRATVSRIIKGMRDHLRAPIEYDQKANGYFYKYTGDRPYELPGLWFNASELYALLATQQLLVNAQPGILEERIAPLRNRIEQILESKYLFKNKGEVGRRIHILRMASRRMADAHFQIVAGAVLQRSRLYMRYHGRASEAITEREISPQRLVHYRDNWYLDAWCHGKRALRSFSIDRILEVHALKKPAKDIPDSELDACFAAAYGIFSGKPKHKAILRFTLERARWVGDELWHPEQVGRIVDEYFELEIPYSEPEELILDILRYGPDVEVIAPASLRLEVAKRLHDAVKQYEKNGVENRKIPNNLTQSIK